MKKLAMVGLCIAVLGMMLCMPTGMAAEKKGEQVKIGAIFAVTGPASFLGAPEEKTAKMLVEKINKEGGVLGHPIELIIKDSGGNPEKAVSFAKQLIEEEKVLAIIGPSTSGETMQIKNLCEENKMILVSCAAAEVIVNPVAKYVFKTPQKDSQAVTWIFNTMKEKGISKVAMLSGSDGFGKAGKNQVESMAQAAGIEILCNEVYDAKATDLTDVLTKVKGTPGVQAVINWTVAPAQSILLKNMKQIGLNLPMFNSHGFGNPKYAAAAGEAAEGTLFPAGRLLVVDELADSNPQKKLLAAYKKDYEGLYKEDVSTFGGHAYDAILFVTEAIKKAKSTDSAKVRDGIEGLKGLVGTAGIFNMSPEDHTGLALDAFEMMTVKGGKITIYKK